MWMIYAIGASMFWGMSYVFSGQTYKHISVTTAIALSSLVTGSVALLTGYLSGVLAADIRTLLTHSQASTYFLYAIGAGLCAEFLIAYSIASKSATLAGMIEISYPIFIALFSYLFFREVIPTAAYIGGLCIFLGIYIIYTYTAS
jgi:drug/metabolite transporter (DMT)-like permease